LSYPLQENLEVFTGAAGPRIRCARCGHVLCEAGADWKSAAKKRRVPPDKAGSLMAELGGQYLLEQACCPSCAALFHTDLIEDEASREEKR
jgi:phage FluMu protein Com